MKQATASKQILIVDDESAMRVALEACLTRCGWQVEVAVGVSDARARFRSGRHALVITDIRMADGSGLDVLREVRKLSPGTAVILLTAFANVPQAVEAMKNGASEYLVKPVSLPHLEQVVARVLSQAGDAVRNEVCAGAWSGDRKGAEPEIVGAAPKLLFTLAQARRAAASDADILLEAESGTGKELLARMIHRLSARRTGPFVAMNCAACPETLLESELFGHGRGAFTGAHAARAGRFELANGGTLLLDEIGELPLSLQPKLLRVLQEREFERLGEPRSVHVNLRVIATTNRSLTQMVQECRFRADLYYRLNVIPLTLPPLRARREDIPQLARHFLALYAPAGRNLEFTAEAMEAMVQSAWPGNIRELANAVRRAAALTESDRIGADLLIPADLLLQSGGKLIAIRSPGSAGEFVPGLSLQELERQLLEKTLNATGGNRSRTAEILGVSLRTIRNKIRLYQLPPRSMYATH